MHFPFASRRLLEATEVVVEASAEQLVNHLGSLDG
jgi:hypothetical protein